MANKKIKNATGVKSGNIQFKSKLEDTVYSTLSELGFNPQYEPTTFELWNGFTPITPFYDEETKSQRKKRLKDSNQPICKLLSLRTNKIVGIRYTPDFYFRYGELDVYIEAKGVENDVFYIKKKLFRYYLDEKLKQTNQHSIFFEIYTKKQLLQAIEIIKDYEQFIRKNRKVDSDSSSEGCSSS